MSAFRAGHIGLAGRSNVGKSTLLNRLLAQKLSIVSRKPQTTRRNLRGIKTTAGAQLIFIDTPGLQLRPKAALNRYMNRQASQALGDVDLILFVVEALCWNALDRHALAGLDGAPRQNIMLVINKLDKHPDKNQLLRYMADLSRQTGLTELLPVSAKSGAGIARLEALIPQKLPLAPAPYPADHLTDQSERFFAAEFLREQLIRRLGHELPYRLTILIEHFKVVAGTAHIHACIWVEKKGQKSIVIGKQGALLKKAGTAARKELERLLDKKVNLKTWVKLKPNWSDSEPALRQSGHL